MDKEFLINNQELKQQITRICVDYPDVMDIGEMCKVLGISKKTGYKLLKDRKIESLKIGRAYRIPKAHILGYLKVSYSVIME